LFGLKHVGIWDNFFELGGHSLMVVRLIDKVHRTLNVSLGISELFQNPTVDQMARVIDGSPVSRPTYPAGVVEIRAGTSDDRSSVCRDWEAPHLDSTACRRR
jgi:Phosphopantetheine attachment site